MKIWTSQHVFEHPWQSVIQGQFRKYPNPHNPAVIGTDVFNRHVTHGVLHSHRIVTSKWGFPSWVTSIVGGDGSGHAYEYSSVDPASKVMTMRTRNISLANVVTMEETMSYTPHPDDPEKTLLKQETGVTVRGLPLCNYLENLIVTTASSNAGKGQQAIDWIVDKIGAEYDNIQSEMTRVRQTVEEALGRFGNECDTIQSEMTNMVKNSVEESLVSPAKRTLDEMQRDFQKLTSITCSPILHSEESNRS